MANKNRKCVHCREYAITESGIVTPVGFFCSFEHATTHAQEKRDKQRLSACKSNAAIARKKKKEFYDNDRSHQLKLTQSTFNAWIRFRDSGLPCASCDKPDNGSHQRHASHYRSVGACPELRFNSLNVHSSCSTCNNHLSGNIAGYRPRLINKIGQDFVDWLDGPHKPKKYTCEQLREIRAYYAKLTREGIKTDEDRPHK